MKPAGKLSRDRFCARSMRPNGASKLTVGTTEPHAQFTNDAANVAALETAVRRVELLRRSLQPFFHRMGQS